MAEDKYVVERTEIIDAPPERIYGQIVDFHNWVNWSPWEDLDPNLVRRYSGAESGTGAVYAWSGNRKAGKGQMTIVDTAEPSRVRVEVAFEKPFNAQNEALFTITQDGTRAKVVWTMTGDKTFMTKVMGLFTSMDKMIGPDFEKGLARLKTTCESPTAG